MLLLLRTWIRLLNPMLVVKVFSLAFDVVFDFDYSLRRNIRPGAFLIIIEILLHAEGQQPWVQPLSTVRNGTTAPILPLYFR